MTADPQTTGWVRHPWKPGEPQPRLSDGWRGVRATEDGEGLEVLPPTERDKRLARASDEVAAWPTWKREMVMSAIKEGETPDTQSTLREKVARALLAHWEHPKPWEDASDSERAMHLSDAAVAIAVVREHLHSLAADLTHAGEIDAGETLTWAVQQLEAVHA